MKNEYKQKVVLVKELKNELKDIQMNLDKNRNLLVEEFEKWYNDNYGKFNENNQKEEDLTFNIEDESSTFFNAKSKVDRLHKKGMMNTIKRK